MWEYELPEEYCYDDYLLYDALYGEKPVKVFIDDDITDDWSSVVRRPYYQMRGKRITPEQAAEIINNREVNSLAMNFGTSYKKYGWVHPNGIIGVNGTTAKYPEIWEFAAEWLVLLHEFPYIDLMIGITWWDEISPKRAEKLHSILLSEENESLKWRKYIEMYDKYKFQPYDDFYENLQLGIRVRDRKIEILNSENTVKLYREYEKLYEEKNKQVYFLNYTSQSDSNIVI